jgi:hypothetical protein
VGLKTEDRDSTSEMREADYIHRRTAEGLTSLKKKPRSRLTITEGSWRYLAKFLS